MKSQLRKRLLFGGGALCLILAVGVLINKAPAPVSATADPALPVSQPIEITQNNPQIPAAESAKTEIAATNATSANAIAELKPFENKTELAEFKILKEKVFLTEEEKEQHKNFLQDRALLENLKTLFKYPAPYQDLEAQQNAAVDLLLEAIKSGGDADTARAVFKELIADPTIENSQLTPAQRQNLAGVKAEVLFQWSALEPERAGEMKNALPGPVSVKIWKNVETQQDLNRAESAITK